MCKFSFFVVCFSFIASGLSSQAAEIPRRENSSTPTQSIRSWHLNEEWRIGTNDTILFGRINDIKMDSKGSTYILDFQTQEVTVIGPKGIGVRILGHQGAGPGETEAASKIFLKENGEIGLLEAFPASIVWLKNNGDPSGITKVNIDKDDKVLLGCLTGSRQYGHLVLAIKKVTILSTGPQSTSHIVGMSQKGNITHTYRTIPKDAYLKGTKNGEVNEGKSYQQLWNRWDVDSAGNLWFASERDQYLVQCATPEGTIVQEFTRGGQRPKRSSYIKRKIQKSLVEIYKHSSLQVKTGEYAPWVNRLWISDSSRGCVIWIESATSFSDLPDGVMVRYDIFNTEGEFLNQVEINGPGDQLFDFWYLFQDKYLVMVRNKSEGGFDFTDETNPRFDDLDLEVICYRILRDE